MTKEKFCEIINKIKIVHDYHNELWELNSRYNNKYRLFDIGDVDSYPTLEDELVDVLVDIYESKDIIYFIYELDFGKDWKPGMVIDNGEDIDLSTVEKLYDYITR